MPNAVRELEIQHEIEHLTPQQRAAVAISSLDPQTAANVFERLTPEETGLVLFEQGLLPPISHGARRRILSEFRREFRVTK